MKFGVWAHLRVSQTITEISFGHILNFSENEIIVDNWSQPGAWSWTGQAVFKPLLCKTWDLDCHSQKTCWCQGLQLLQYTIYRLSTVISLSIPVEFLTSNWYLGWLWKRFNKGKVIQKPNYEFYIIHRK